LPKTGQTICNVTDRKIIKLFVDDKLFWLPDANLLSCDRRLNIKSGTLDREILWETPAGKQVLIASRRLVTFADWHVAAISYCVTLLNAEAPVVISSEMVANGQSACAESDDPRKARDFSSRVLHPPLGEFLPSRGGSPGRHLREVCIPRGLPSFRTWGTVAM